jgi:hypothetical protein
MADEHVEGPDRGRPPIAAADASDAAPERPELSPDPAAPAAPQTDPPAAAGAATEPPAPTPAPRRALKLVVTLRPDDGTGYHAILALGGVPSGPGCDPLLRSADVADLEAALDEVPGLLAEAEARWEAQPRNPSAQPARPARAAAPQRTPAPSPAPGPAATETAAPAPTPAKAPNAGQLSLFG